MQANLPSGFGSAGTGPAVIGQVDPADRPAVHLIWEGALLVPAVVLAIVAFVSVPGAHFSAIFGPAGSLGLIATGLALSLRTGTSNLAVGSIATATGVLGAHFATADRWPFWGAMAFAVAAAAVVGLFTGLLVAALSVPAWAATLAVAFLAQAAADGISGLRFAPLRGPISYSTGLWLTVVVGMGVAVWFGRSNGLACPPGSAPWSA